MVYSPRRMTSCAPRSASLPTPTPSRQISTSPMATSILRGSMSTPALPIAARMRPQLGSAPKMAVLHSGDWAMRARHRVGGRGALGAAHLDGDDVGGAFAVAHDLARQLVEHVVHRLRATAFAAWPAVDRLVLGGARRHEEDRVVGRGVAVDGHGVEGRLDLLAQHGAQERLRHGRVGAEEGQRGGHVGRDHAGALGHADDARLGLAARATPGAASASRSDRWS